MSVIDMWNGCPPECRCGHWDHGQCPHPACGCTEYRPKAA